MFIRDFVQTACQETSCGGLVQRPCEENRNLHLTKRSLSEGLNIEISYRYRAWRLSQTLCRDSITRDFAHQLLQRSCQGDLARDLLQRSSQRKLAESTLQNLVSLYVPCNTVCGLRDNYSDQVHCYRTHLYTIYPSTYCCRRVCRFMPRIVFTLFMSITSIIEPFYILFEGDGRLIACP